MTNAEAVGKGLELVQAVRDVMDSHREPIDSELLAVQMEKLLTDFGLEEAIQGLHALTVCTKKVLEGVMLLVIKQAFVRSDNDEPWRG